MKPTKRRPMHLPLKPLKLVSKSDDSAFQPASSLGALPTDLLLEIFEFTHFDTLLALTLTCHRLRTLTLGWVLRHYRVTGICSFGENVHLSSDNEAVLKANFAAITHLSIFLPLEFRCAADFQAKWTFLQVFIAVLPNLSSFTCRLDDTASRYSHSGKAYYHKRLFRRFWDANLSRKHTVVLRNGCNPYVLKSIYEWEMGERTRCLAGASLLRRGAAIVGHNTLKGLLKTISGCRKAVLHAAGANIHQTWPPRPDFSYIELDSPSIVLKRIHVHSRPFTLFVSGHESLTTFHLSSKDVAYLDWSTLLPVLDFPRLNSVTIHQDCRGLTTGSLHEFLARHPSITELIVTLDDRKLIQAEAFKQCLPNLKVIAGPVHAILEILRSIQSPLKLTRAKITEFHAERLTTRRHQPLDFSALDAALDLLASCPLKELGIGLPGLAASKDWLTKSSPTPGPLRAERFGGLEVVVVWSYDCRPMDQDINVWLEQFRERNFPGTEQVTNVHYYQFLGFPLEPCRVRSGSGFRY